MDQQCGTSDTQWMRHAIHLARQAWGKTHPNPMVGSLIVDQAGFVLGEGFHAKAGEPHAEVMALRAAAGKDLSKATLFVTLEPCCTHGRTPPCTDAIIRSGIRQVVVGAVDPNPQHSGHGLTVLRDAGIQVTEGVLAGDCAELNLIFHHWISSQSPLLAGKVATTIDGRIATRTNDSRWITGPESRNDVMRWRRYFPSIAVGSGTVIADNPQLTSRIPGTEAWCPIRFIFDRTCQTLLGDPLPLVFTDSNATKTILVHTASVKKETMDKLDAIGIKHWALPDEVAAFWPTFRQRCMEAGICGVYIEGGARLLGDLIAHKQLDYLFAYRSPLLFADSEARSAFLGSPLLTISDAARLKSVRHEVHGEDSLMRGHLSYSPHE